MKQSNQKFADIRKATLIKLNAIYLENNKDAELFNELNEQFNDLIDQFVSDNPNDYLDVDVNDLTFFTGFAFEEDEDFWSKVEFEDTGKELDNIYLPDDYDYEFKPSMALCKATGRCV